MSEIHSAMKIYNIDFKVNILAWLRDYFWRIFITPEVIRGQFCPRHCLWRCFEDNTLNGAGIALSCLCCICTPHRMDSSQWRQQKLTKKQKWLDLLLSSSLYCLGHNRQINREELLEQRIMSLSRKPADWEDGELSVPKNYLLQVRIQAYFMLRAERVKTWFQPDSRGEVSISSFLQSFTCGPG